MVNLSANKFYLILNPLFKQIIQLVSKYTAPHCRYATNEYNTWMIKIRMSNMIRFLLLGLSALTLFACSTDKMVYRIETTSGDILYSEDEPDLNDNDYYEVEDLDGNEYQIKSNLLYKVDKYTRKK